jgi:hypothetical protein
MALEEKIDQLTAAVISLTAKIGAEGGNVASGKGSTTTAAGAKNTAAGAKAGKAASSKPKHTPDDVKTAVLEVKAKKGDDAAREVIEGAIGEGGKLAQLLTTPDKFAKAMELATAALEAEDDYGDDEDDNGGL